MGRLIRSALYSGNLESSYLRNISEEKSSEEIIDGVWDNAASRIQQADRYSQRSCALAQIIAAGV